MARDIPLLGTGIASPLAGSLEQITRDSIAAREAAQAAAATAGPAAAVADAARNEAVGAAADADADRRAAVAAKAAAEAARVIAEAARDNAAATAQNVQQVMSDAAAAVAPAAADAIRAQVKADADRAVAVAWQALPAITEASAAVSKDLNRYVTPNRTVDITAATIGLGKPAAIPNPITGRMDIHPTPTGVRQALRNADGTIWERSYDGATWTTWGQTAGFGARIKSAEDATANEAAARAAEMLDLRASEQLEDGTYPLLSASGQMVLGLRNGQVVGPGIGAGDGGIPVPAGQSGWDASGDEAAPVWWADCGAGLVDKVRLNAGLVMPPAGRELIVLMAMGQSQAGVTAMHASDPNPWRTTGPAVRHHVFALNDQTASLGGVRGWMGAVPSLTPTGLANVTYPAGVQDNMSAAGALLALLAPGAPASIARSEAQGGSEFVQETTEAAIHKLADGSDARPYTNFVASARAAVTLGRAAGFVVSRLFVGFDHGEADATTTTYAAEFTAFRGAFEGALADLGVSIQWFVTQYAGRGSYSRQHFADLAAAPPANVTVVASKQGIGRGTTQAGEPYDVHHRYDQRIKLGELYGHAMLAHLAAQKWVPPYMSAATRSGNVVTVDFASMTTLVVDPVNYYLPPSRNIGFSGTNAAGQPIYQTAWRQVGPRRFEATFGVQPASIRYNAFAHDPSLTDEGQDYAITAGLIRDQWSAPCRFLPGEVNYRWALGSEIALGA